MVVAVLQAKFDSMGDFLSIGEPSAQTEGRDVV